MVRDADHVMLITDGGKVIRMPVRDISVIGRNTQGVRLIDLAEGEKVVGVACVAETEGDDAGGKESEPAPDEPAA
jgi:DNA gyrase subunit A